MTTAAAVRSTPAKPRANDTAPEEKIETLLDLLPKTFPMDKDEVRDDESRFTAALPIFRFAILLSIAVLGFAIRTFSVTKGESQIHEFDPHFNWRVTGVLASEGWYDFLNYFDDRVWYPLGRNVGQTVYPGLMYVAAMIYWTLNAINISINVRNSSVYVGPIFAGFTAVVTYLFTAEVTRRPSTGLLAAAMSAIVPSIISRSGAGGYDNESVAIFALICTFWLWVKAVNTGSLMVSIFCAFSYGFMVAAWGGYIFVGNLIPIHVCLLIAAGRYTPRLYVAYSTWWAVGSILAVQTPFVGFNIVTAAENASVHGVFVVVQAYAVVIFLREHVSGKTLNRIFLGALIGVVSLTFLVLVGMQLLGKVQWTGRSLTLLDPSYAKKYLPIIASVSEHQPTTWSSFFFDLHVLVPLAPAGLFYLYREPSDAAIFTILYGSIAWYFAGVMVRLMLTLAPIACILAAVAVSESLHAYGNNVKKLRVAMLPSSLGGILVLLSMMLYFSVHSSFIAHEAYSGSSIVIQNQLSNGERVILDDFREAYYWLQQNTHPDSKIMSWWDYGYQTSQLANRTTIVDNNTANNTHIACVGRAMASSEKDAYPILLSLDVDYVLVLFGGVAGYSSDDINKFLWMVRIGGGVFPIIQEADYFAGGHYRMDAGGSPVMLRSLMYRLSYYRFSEMDTRGGGTGRGFDRVRNVEVGDKNIVLEYLDEAFTSEHWIMRIYKVRKPLNRPIANAPTTTKRASPSDRQETPEPRFLGCVSSENALPADKKYHGGASGAHIKLAQSDAILNKKRYFAVARAGSDGHSFSFDSPPKTFDASQDAGCSRSCLDDKTKTCGCSDAACEELGNYAVPPETNNRRWAVYSTQ